MLHIIAFAAIGIVVGYFIGQNTKGLVPIIIAGLVGSFVPGLLIHTSTSAASKYGSLVVAIIGALVLSYLGKMIFAPKKA